MLTWRRSSSPLPPAPQPLKLNKLLLMWQWRKNFLYKRTFTRFTVTQYRDRKLKKRSTSHVGLCLGYILEETPQPSASGEMSHDHCFLSFCIFDNVNFVYPFFILQLFQGFPTTKNWRQSEYSFAKGAMMTAKPQESITHWVPPQAQVPNSPIPSWSLLKLLPTITDDHWCHDHQMFEIEVRFWFGRREEFLEKIFHILFPSEKVGRGKVVVLKDWKCFEV